MTDGYHYWISTDYWSNSDFHTIMAKVILQKAVVITIKTFIVQIDCNKVINWNIFTCIGNCIIKWYSTTNVYSYIRTQLSYTSWKAIHFAHDLLCFPHFSSCPCNYQNISAWSRQRTTNDYIHSCMYLLCKLGINIP